MRPLIFALCVIPAFGSLSAQKPVWQPSPGHTQVSIWPGAVTGDLASLSPLTLQLGSALLKQAGPIGLILAFAVLVPVLEELLFRGVLLQALGRTTEAFSAWSAAATGPRLCAVTTMRTSSDPLFAYSTSTSKYRSSAKASV